MADSIAPAEATTAIGLIDFRSYGDLVDALAEALGQDHDSVRERLFNEALLIGWNVSKAAREFGVTPHVHDTRMQRLYSETDAFVFELAVVHMSAYCQEVDGRVIEAVQRYAPETQGAKVLMLGDGIGSDALRFASLGYDVTYFEFEGPSAQFAKYRFARSSVAGAIRVLNRTLDIPTNAFDVVVCREVLEHVPEVRRVVASVRRYLVDGGVAVVTESFARIEPSLPTHLLENVPYAGHTVSLFIECGFSLCAVYPEERPFVFRNHALGFWRGRASAFRYERPLSRAVQRVCGRVAGGLPI